MKAPAPLKGSCLCGACTFTATPEGDGAYVCHCEMCRKWTAGMFMSVGCADELVFDDESHLGIYRASEWGERLFCKSCGSSLAWRMQDHTGTGVSMQAFDDPSQFVLRMQWFIDRKPDNYALVNETETKTQAETFAIFAPEGQG